MKDKKLSYIDAAKVILYKNGGPMHYQDITDEAIANRILDKKEGKTQEATLGSDIYTDRKKKKEESVFEHVSGGVFALTSKGRQIIESNSHLKSYIAKVTPVLYVLKNEAMPGYIKIGISTRAGLPVRIKNLSGTSVPCNFELIYVFMHPKAEEKEKQIARHFTKSRVNPNKEFYKEGILSDGSLLSSLRLTDGIQLDNAEFEKTSRRKDTPKTKSPPIKDGRKKLPASFKMLEIPIGSELTFIDNPSIKCRVANDGNKVTYDGREKAISALAMDILIGLGKSLKSAPQGGIYWVYEGETLVDRRKRLGK